MEELSNQIIKEYFQNTILDTLYYDYFSKQAKKCFEELELSEPNRENEDEEISNVSLALRYAKKLTLYYVKEVIKGHSIEWADSWANNNLFNNNEDDVVRMAYKTIKDKNEADKDLDIYLEELSDDPIFYKRYKYLFQEINLHIKEQATDYCVIYHACKKGGKSDYYAHAYAEAKSNRNENILCDIYARAYELARMKEMKHQAAVYFGDKCTDAKQEGYILDLESFIKLYHENWQIEFYQQLIEAYLQDEKQYNKEELMQGIRKIIAKIKRQFGE